jgi:flavin reductase (DIM6/NTAB) family NADH-FMN oxidoreductase RutF
MRKTLDELEARRLLTGGPVLLVTTSWHAKANVMPVAYAMPLSFTPPLVGIAVHPSRHTHDMIRFSEEFAINVPGRNLLHHVQYLGSVSGSELDKLELTKLPTIRARKVEAPLIDGCVGYIECGLEDALRFGDHTLFVGRVVAASVDNEAFDETWLLADDDYKPLHYLGLNRYAILGQTMEARVPKPAEEAEEKLEEAVEEQRELTHEEEEKRREEEERTRREEPPRE